MDVHLSKTSNDEITRVCEIFAKLLCSKLFLGPSVSESRNRVGGVVAIFNRSPFTELPN